MDINKFNIKKNEVIRILVCSDILSTADREQKSNVNWLYDILKRPIKLATDIDIEKFIANEKEAFSRFKFFKMSNITINTLILQIDYQENKITENSIYYLKEYIGENTLLIGYEFSLNTRKVLDRFNIPYIDIWLHPIRFLDDVLFGFNSNVENIFNKICRYHYSENNYYLYADRFKVSTYKGFKRVSNKIEQNSALLVGQTLEDKAVLKDGKFLNLMDFKDKILEISNTHSKIYFSRHPYEKRDAQIIEFLKTIPNLELINIPAYYFLVNDNIRTVFGISSSVIVEASYFDKNILFLHKPVLNISNRFSIDSYRSIMQDFLYGHFWSDILSSFIKTNSVEKIELFDKKDKIRDMLGFYWSYKHIDKLEMTRNTTNENGENIQLLSNRVKNLEEKIQNNHKDKKKISETIKINEIEIWNGIKEKINDSSIISFDLFDTLLVRPFDNPNDIFDLMSNEVETITNGKIKASNFRKLRESARSLVKNNTGEEVSLIKRYEALVKKENLEKDLALKLLNLELTFEKKYLYVREIAKKIFEYAKSLNKKIIIITDTFYDNTFLKQILDINDYLGYYKIYSSEEIGLLKHTGNLYPYVLNDLKISPEKILHIGDNITSDIKNAEMYNINTLYLNRTLNVMKEKSGLDKSLSFKNHITASIIKGVIANKMMDNPLTYSYPSHSSGKKDIFGFSSLGPMFYGFTKWLIENAIKDNIDTLYFLARDGFIVKQCYDILSKKYDNPPKAIYLYASRRALSVPSISSEEDIIEICSINFSSTTLKTILENRFGIDISKLTITENDIRQFGFTSFDTYINSNKDGKNFVKLCLFIKENIFINSSKEKELMIEYFKQEGLIDCNNAAIVDIGHNGTLQYRINRILNRTNIDGYYFVTQKGIIDTIYNNGMKAKGYVAEEINSKDKRHPYNKYILIFESCFLNKEGTLKNLYKKNDKIMFNQRKIVNEKVRLDFIDEVHSGVINFIEVLSKFDKNNQIDIIIEGRESINPFLAILNHPYQLDIEMFNKVSFENYYSGRDNIYIVYYDKNSKKDSKKLSYWNDWIENVYFKDSNDISNDFKVSYFLSFSFKLLNKLNLLDDSKYNKFLNKPKEFFRDSKYTYLRNKYIKS